MASIAVQSVSEEVGVTLENGIVETCSKIESKTLVAISSENIEASIAKFDDSGILTSKNDSDMTISSGSVALDAKENKQLENQEEISNDKCSQESDFGNYSSKSSQVSSNKENQCSSTKFSSENSNSSDNCTLKRSQSINNDDENSCSSARSTSTVKTSQHASDRSDDESNHESNSRCSSRKSSPQKCSQTTNSSKSSQNSHSDSTEDSNSRSSLRSSVSRSPTKASQSVSYKSGNESSRSSFKSPTKNLPGKLNHDVITELVEDNDSRSSSASSNSTSTMKNSQPVTEKSDNENNSSSTLLSSSNKKMLEKPDEINENKKKKYYSIVDSDSEDEISAPQKSKINSQDAASSNTANISKMKKKTRKLIDSDSDEEIISTKTTPKQFDAVSGSINEKKNSKVTKKPNKISSIVDSESESDRESDIEKNSSKVAKHCNNLRTLVDSDSESDANQHSDHDCKDDSDRDNNVGKPKKGKGKLEKKRTGSARASKDVAMQQIHSETQRLIRESQVSLPYHRPKQRTLAEFLNRKKVPSNLPKNFTNAERIKMFPEIISKVVSEKEKEAEVFYQSSDSEEDDKNNTTMEVDSVDDENKIENGVKNSENSNLIQIFTTQKLTQDDIQDSHNKKELLLQRSVDFGATKKLFSDSAINMKGSEIGEEHLNAGKHKQSDTQETRKVEHEESATNHNDNNVSRKLFAENDESMDVDVDTNNYNESVTVQENEKVSEIINQKTNSPTKETSELDNSCEDIVLNVSETELDSSEGKKIEFNQKNDSKACEQLEEFSMPVTPLLNQREILKTNENAIAQVNDHSRISDSASTENSEDPTTKLPNGVEDDDEIVDKNMLKNNFIHAPDFDASVKEPSLKKKILSNATKLKPIIKSSPGGVIDLTTVGPIEQGASKLLDRFLSRHAPTHKPVVEEVSEVKITRLEGVGDDIKLVEEVLPFKKTLVEDERREKKPGEQLKKLREDLKLKIAEARDEEWKHKEEDEIEEEEEENKCRGDDFYEGLPDEEEVLDDEDSGESEPEEDDMPIVEKPRRTCEFGDEEAEESEIDNDENEANEEEDEESEKEEDEKEEDDEEEESESESEKEEAPRKPKKLRRIISAFDDESNESEPSLSSDPSRKTKLERAKTDEDMFSSQTSNDRANEEVEAENIQLFQFRQRCDSDSRSQACKTPLPKANNILSMISPVAQLTALNTSLESAKKSASKTNNFDLGRISSQNTPTESSDRKQNNCNTDKMVNLQKKLFDDPAESVNDDELLALCSGKFTGTQSSGVPAISSQNGVTDSQLMDICSGAFSTQVVEEKKLDDTTVLITDETSQDITLAIDDEEESKNSPSKRSSSLKRSDESMFSSDSSKMSKSSSIEKNVFKNPMETWLKKASAKSTQVQTQKKEREVTDSQLMDLCSGAFTTQPIDLEKLEQSSKALNHDEVSQDFELTLDDNSNGALKENVVETKEQELPIFNHKVGEEPSKHPHTGLRIASSSEDEMENKTTKEKTKKKVFKKKKVAKLQLSDDEDDELKEFSELEESEIEEEEEEKFVDYDSEENEVVVVPKKEIRKVAKKFLENEAELSESDWDSADEDERGLDKLEFEEGDVEDIDESKMKDELDRIRMKQVMDEDQRDVRMLQELLFDDGDLHSEGAGRERKFKWKNIDSISTDDVGPIADGDPEVIDDEVDTTVELQMRKMRYEQMKFQEEKEENISKVLDDDFDEGPLCKAGLKVIDVRTNKTSIGEQKMNKANSINNPIKMGSKSTINLTKKSLTTSFSFSNMRGSFLSRGEETLVRIAQHLPEKNTVSLGSLRNKKFVFEHLSPSVSDAQKDDSEQENDNTPAKDKKGNARKRKIFSSQTPRSTKKLKVDDRAAGKKLF